MSFAPTSVVPVGNFGPVAVENLQKPWGLPYSASSVFNGIGSWDPTSGGSLPFLTPSNRAIPLINDTAKASLAVYTGEDGWEQELATGQLLWVCQSKGKANVVASIPVLNFRLEQAARYLHHKALQDSWPGKRKNEVLDAEQESQLALVCPIRVSNGLDMVHLAAKMWKFYGCIFNEMNKEGENTARSASSYGAILFLNSAVAGAAELRDTFPNKVREGNRVFYKISMVDNNYSQLVNPNGRIEIGYTGAPTSIPQIELFINPHNDTPRMASAPIEEYTPYPSFLYPLNTNVISNINFKSTRKNWSNMATKPRKPRNADVDYMIRVPIADADAAEKLESLRRLEKQVYKMVLSEKEPLSPTIMFDKYTTGITEPIGTVFKVPVRRQHLSKSFARDTHRSQSHLLNTKSIQVFIGK